MPWLLLQIIYIQSGETRSGSTETDQSEVVGQKNATNSDLKKPSSSLIF